MGGLSENSATIEPAPTYGTAHLPLSLQFRTVAARREQALDPIEHATLQAQEIGMLAKMQCMTASVRSEYGQVCPSVEHAARETVQRATVTPNMVDAVCAHTCETCALRVRGLIQGGKY